MAKVADLAARLLCIGIFVLTGYLGAPPVSAQQSAPPPPQTSQALTSQSTLVLVPVIVKQHDGEAVFGLTSENFTVTDDGVPQKIHLQSDPDLQPLALVIVAQTGGVGVDHIKDYSDLDAVLDALIGAVPHKVAVVSFDSQPHDVQRFTGDMGLVSQALSNLEDGDRGAAVLDALAYGIDMLRQAPPSYRRAILFISQTLDAGSQTTLEQAVAAVNETNTAIYSLSFSVSKSEVKHEAAKVPLPGGTVYGDTPYGPGGCMGYGNDPDAHGNRRVQALDCLEDLAPPLRLARMAFYEARDGLKKNVPEAVAHQTGGEYFDFKDNKTLVKRLEVITNDMPAYYVLSFSPEAPTPGMHALAVTVPAAPGAQINARKAYWAGAPPEAQAPPASTPTPPAQAPPPTTTVAPHP
jgi:VWFA-related protein